MYSFKNLFIKSLAGILASHLIGLAFLPIVSWLYTPEDLGHLRFFQVVLGLILVVSCFRYEIAILRARTESESRSAATLCVLLCFAMMLAVAIVGGVLSFLVEIKSFNFYALVFYLPISVLIGGLHLVVTNFQIREKSLLQASGCRIVQSTSYIASSICLSQLHATGLVLADTISKMLSVTTYLGVVIGKGRRAFNFSGGEIWNTAFHFRSLPLVSTVGGLVNVAGGLFTSAMIYWTFNASIAGQLTFAERCASIPVGILGAALGQAYNAKLSTDLRINSQEVRRDFQKLVLNCFLIGFLPTVLLSKCSPYFFEHFFGHNWKLAGELAQRMSPLFLMQFVMCPINLSLLLLGHAKTQFAWETTRLLIFTAGWAGLVFFKCSLEIAITFHVLISVIMIAVFIILTDRALQNLLAMDTTVVFSNGQL